MELCLKEEEIIGGKGLFVKSKKVDVVAQPLIPGFEGAETVRSLSPRPPWMHGEFKGGVSDMLRSYLEKKGKRGRKSQWKPKYYSGVGGKGNQSKKCNYSI